MDYGSVDGIHLLSHMVYKVAAVLHSTLQLSHIYNFVQHWLFFYFEVP